MMKGSFVLVFVALIAFSQGNVYMTSDMDPTPGPESPDTVYIPGNPGGQWTPDEVDTTRQRILQMITPDWTEQYEIGNADSKSGRNKEGGPGQCTENVLMRLVFHDCIPYVDSNDGWACDGCMNWHGMHSDTPNPNDKSHYYQFDPLNATDNKGLDGAVIALEKIYTTIDWPLLEPSLEISLKQSGKSRADLWQLAGLVALERALERANRACDLDFHARQQVTLLEGRDKCEFKLTKPLKFLTGRADCISDDPEGRGYVTSKAEDQPVLMSNGNYIVDYGKNFMNVDADKWMALQAIHGAVHAAMIGVKYTWFGMGYISNMYFKMIANHPTYEFKKGGDLSFTSCGEGIPIQNVAYGSIDGNAVNRTGWRASCMYLWNTDEGGPCFLRPIGDTCADAPAPDQLTYAKCVSKLDSNGQCSEFHPSCKNAYCDENNVVHDGRISDPDPEVVGPWTEDLSDIELQTRHNCGWNNQFAFPWEVGMFWNMTVGGVGQRAIGCTGLDAEFGTITDPKWPYRNKNSPIFGSPAMDCPVNDYAPEGKPMYQIVDELASDNELFAEKFLEGWQQMTSNGYSDGDLVDGPDNGWIGYYSLSQQGVEIGNFASYIADNAPVTFTDPEADPWICGHRGHSTVTCGYRFSKYFELASQEGADGCIL